MSLAVPIARNSIACFAHRGASATNRLGVRECTLADARRGYHAGMTEAYAPGMAGFLRVSTTTAGGLSVLMPCPANVVFADAARS